MGGRPPARPCAEASAEETRSSYPPPSPRRRLAALSSAPIQQRYRRLLRLAIARVRVSRRDTAPGHRIRARNLVSATLARGRPAALDDVPIESIWVETAGGACL